MMPTTIDPISESACKCKCKWVYAKTRCKERPAAAPYNVHRCVMKHFSNAFNGSNGRTGYSLNRSNVPVRKCRFVVLVLLLLLIDDDSSGKSLLVSSDCDFRGYNLVIVTERVM